MATQLTNPYRGFRFQVEISGIQIASFSEATIPDSTIETTEYREGTDPTYKRSFSGLTTYGKLTLKKGLTDTLDLYNWHQLAVAQGSTGDTVQKNVSLILLDSAGTARARWNVINAWPSKYESTGFNASSTEIMVETFELTIQYMTRVS
ncbi:MULTISPECIES: phage tail protein [Burkholderia]|uniref:Phage tail protein n=1 Tax=Burkholderia gladioli TaxID=28095 RepID=A0A2A7SFE5_BURGA|nr:MULTISPECIES: phage tail protein [Burkholderia]ATF87452.1 phage tail protein [Burkholderia gladioli pv. gladioli]MBJ9660023.1 phage tail protein [Burkholderia gladioli]MBJ9711495.1 phage tail protein [Burkholderia gladioli]MBU9158154.1 phage tail protein [Burkholderia gladioli]MBU9168191.1 phage tail protein [Burkholderia gladioli]